MRSILPALLPALLLSGCATFDTNLKASEEPEDGGDGLEEACTEQAWYADADDDGFGGSTRLDACEAPDSSGWVSVDGDCDDEEPAIHPDAEELCNEQDDDCDSEIDEDTTDGGTFYIDADGDLFGDAPVTACAQPEGTVLVAGDCDDAQASVNPEGVEICNAIDDDCNGEIDDEPSDPSTFYADADADGHGDPDSTVQACSPPDGFVDVDDDCDDADDSRWDVCFDPTVTTASCLHGYSLSTYDSGLATTPELHIVGVYEPDSSGSVLVDIDRSGDVVLVLSSYEPVSWVVRASSSTRLNEVVLNGYNTHSVSGIGSATLTRQDGVSTMWSACAYGWPSTTGGCDTPSLVSKAESWTGMSTRSFSGCYVATDFYIR